VSVAAAVLQPAGCAATVDFPCSLENQGAAATKHLLPVCFCSELDAAVLKLGLVIDLLQVCTVQEIML
jgi:hypothetical protein